MANSFGARIEPRTLVHLEMQVVWRPENADEIRRATSIEPLFRRSLRGFALDRDDRGGREGIRRKLR
jgi:hypothetical protein